MSLVGRTYLARGVPVAVIAKWRETDVEEQRVSQEFADGLIHSIVCQPHGDRRHTGPHNVLVRYLDGTLVVRPFRGLRKVPA